MQSAIHTAETSVSKSAYRAGWAISGLLILFLAFDGAIKLVPLDIVTQTMGELGWPTTASMARTLGVLTLACTILYAVPRTAVLGAILLTAYLGGAIATHVRIGNPLFSHTLFGVYLGVMAWGGLYLRDERLRALIPLGR
ncbi:DoxX family protein [Mesorhizobium zhangyense]|uniref:DoxX family protein n=1 Tax=Mesorhizobium zhangyense TaxID=1776730 RepID=UPI00197C527D|nr:DoxX family protein [Mesorhizobium zhangyense]